MLRRLLPERITAVLEKDSSPLPVAGDPSQLEQILVNLVLNARDAMASGGRLTVRTLRQGDEVCLEVEDTGMGMSRELRERIFEPFFTTREQGTGLGLAVVHGIVTGHGGRIEVSTEEGRGSSFRVWLPLASPINRGEAAGGRETGGPSGLGERVLLVEDDPGAREGLAGILRLLGYVVTEAASGEGAMEIPADPPFDVLLTDYMLPGSSGLEVAGALRERWPGLQVIVMSGYAEDQMDRTHLGQASVRFLQKPFDMATLARELRAALA